MRFLEFFAANIHKPHTRRAYALAVEEFLAMCAGAPHPASNNGSPRSATGLIGS